MPAIPPNKLPPSTLEHHDLIDELYKLHAIANSDNSVRDVHYRTKRLFYLGFFGYRLRIEKRKMTVNDFRYGLGAIGFAGLISLTFVVEPATIPAFLGASPYIFALSPLAVIVAAIRRIRLSDWFFIIYMLSYLMAAASLLPVLFLGENQSFAPIFAAAILFSVSLAIFLNIAFCAYVLRANLASFRLSTATS